MRIAIATDNSLKPTAFEETIKEYNLFPRAKLVQLNQIRSGVSEQPIGLEDTVAGALNRAVRSFEYRDGLEAFELGVGIESGLVRVPGLSGKMLNMCVCIIYNGERHEGWSSAFQFPRPLTDLVQKKGISVRQAGLELKYTDNPNIAHEEGLLGFFTKERMTRLKYMKQAVAAALVSFVRPEFYR